MRAVLFIALLIGLTGCLPEQKNNYLLFEHNKIEFFHSRPIDSVYVADSRVYIDFDDQDKQALADAGEVFGGPVEIDVYVGEKFYVTAVAEFGERTLQEGPISLPENPETIHVFREAGIRVRR